MFERTPTVAACALLLIACGDDTPSPVVAATTGASADAGATGSATVDAGTGGGANGVTGGLAGTTGATAGPSPVFVDGGGPPNEGCDDALRLTLRDFTEEHPDFEGPVAAQAGLVMPDLGPDFKPVYAHPGSTPATTGPEDFDQWYRDVPDVNMTFEVEIAFQEDPQQPGRYVYDNSEFFPLDDMGFGNGPVDLVGGILGGLGLGGGEAAHNFLFTTEAHTRFTYQGGEVFTFRGDDDLWIFINGKLAIDLGGVHGALEQTVDLDAQAAALGITVGETYPMDIFHAERHTNESNFRIETTIDLSCIENVVIPVL